MTGAHGLRKPKPATSNTEVARGGTPQRQILKGYEQPYYDENEDTDDYQDNNNTEIPGKDVAGVSRKDASPLSQRPKTISPKLPRQGGVSKGLSGITTKMQSGPGIQKRVAPKKLRNVQPGGPKQYGGGALYGF
jgi:hypothetical protein